MKTKVVFVLALIGLLTFIVLNNRHEVPFWFFGERSVSLLLLMAVVLAMGIAMGIAVRSRKSATETMEDEDEFAEEESGLDEEDRDYIS